MAGEKTFRTQFLIGAKWVGGAGVKAAQRGLSLLERHAQRGRRAMQGMTASVFKGVASYDLLKGAASGAVRVLAKSIEAASEAQEIHDELGLSIERNAKRYKNTMGKSVAETTRIVEESTAALVKASEVMEMTGHDAETLQKGWASLAATGALDPKQILEQRDAFSDVLSYMYGANATAEESQQLGEMWADTILRGNIAMAKRMDLSTGEIELLKNVTALEKKGSITGEEAIKRRQDLLLKFGKKFEGETKRVFERPSGKIAQMWTQVGNVFEKLGEPFIERAPEMGEAFAQLAKDMEPAARELAKITAEGLKGISDWFKEHKEEIPKWFKFVEEGLKRVYDLLMLIHKVPVLFDLPKALKRMEEPVKTWLPKTQGQPPQEPSAALQQGEAGRRMREAQAKARGKSTGYAPYSPQARAVSAAEEEFYQPGGPSAMPGKIGAPTATTAAAVGNMSGNLMAKVKEMEGFYQKAYWDYKQWSIGYGTKAGGAGETITREGAEKALAAELAVHQANVDRAAASVGLKLTPGQRDALTSFDFNTGDAARLITSSGGNIAEIERRMPSWNKVTEGGRKVVNPGLVARRAKEMAMFHSQEKAIEVATQVQEKAAAAATKTEGDKSYDLLVAQMEKEAAIEAKKPVPITAPTSSLKSMIKEMNLQQRGSGAPGPQNIAMNAPITVNGVAPGREALMAKKTALALRDPTAQLLTEIKRARTQEQRLGYV